MGGLKLFFSIFSLTSLNFKLNFPSPTKLLLNIYHCYCSVLYCTVRYYIVLYCTVSHYTALYSTLLYSTLLYFARLMQLGKIERKKSKMMSTFARTGGISIRSSKRNINSLLAIDSSLYLWIIVISIYVYILPKLAPIIINRIFQTCWKRKLLLILCIFYITVQVLLRVDWLKINW